MKLCAILCLSLLRFTASEVPTDVPDNYHVYSSREGCVSVKSAEPCPVTWKLPTDASISYRAQSGAVRALLVSLNIVGVNSVCEESLRKTLCSQIAPRCLEDGRRLDYGDVNSTCQKIYRSCPKNLADAYKRQNICSTSVTGEHQKFKCVSASKPIKGVCPQPKYKMPSNYLSYYEEQSKNLNMSLKILKGLTNSSGSPLFSSICLFEMRGLSCSAFYCSADEKYLLTEHTRENCLNWINKCFSSPAIEAVMKLKKSFEESCKTYPAVSVAGSRLPQILLLIVSLLLKVFI